MNQLFPPGDLFQIKTDWHCYLVDDGSLDKPPFNLNRVVRIYEGDPLVFLKSKENDSFTWNVLFLHPTYGVCLATDIHLKLLERVEVSQ